MHTIRKNFLTVPSGQPSNWLSITGSWMINCQRCCRRILASSGDMNLKEQDFASGHGEYKDGW